MGPEREDGCQSWYAVIVNVGWLIDSMHATDEPF
jgi:hypothetical protein